MYFFPFPYVLVSDDTHQDANQFKRQFERAQKINAGEPVSDDEEKKEAAAENVEDRKEEPEKKEKVPVEENKEE